MVLKSILSQAERVMPMIVDNDHGASDHEQPATLIFVAGNYSNLECMPVMADGNQIGSFSLKHYQERTFFEKCLQSTLKHHIGEITALLIDEANDLTAIIPLGNAQSICTAALIAQCCLFESKSQKRPVLAH